MQIEKIAATATTITFSRKELYLFLSVINETTNGLYLDTSQKKRLNKTKESADELRDEIYRILDAT